MKLEDKFLNTFFYLFCLGIVFSIIIVIIILSYYSKGFLDKTTANDVSEVEIKYARNSIYSANLSLSDLISKIKLILEKQLSLFKLAEKALNLSDSIDNRNIKDVYSVWDTPKNNEDLKKRLSYASLWFVNPDLKDLRKNEVLFNQIFLFSLLTQTFYENLNSFKGLVTSFYFMFEDTNAFITYPYEYYSKTNNVLSFLNHTSNPSYCSDNNGNINYYKFKCRGFYKDIIQSKTSRFDNNIQDQKNRKTYITPPYLFFASGGEVASFTMCIEFKYNISNTNGYICADIEGNNVFNTFNKINDKLLGYFTISSVGFNNQFYFPNIISLEIGKTLGEYIFNWDIDYYLEEKLESSKTNDI